VQFDISTLYVAGPPQEQAPQQPASSAAAEDIAEGGGL
jgi:hypothetical protein